MTPQQLAPVAKDEEWNLLKEHYASTFSTAKHFRKCLFQHRTSILRSYRQSDSIYQPVNKIGERLMMKPPDAQPAVCSWLQTWWQTRVYHLTTHNYLCPANQQPEEAELPVNQYRFTAEINNDFRNTPIRQMITWNWNVVPSNVIEEYSSAIIVTITGKSERLPHQPEQNHCRREKMETRYRLKRASGATLQYTINWKRKEITERSSEHSANIHWKRLGPWSIKVKGLPRTCYYRCFCRFLNTDRYM